MSVLLLIIIVVVAIVALIAFVVLCLSIVADVVGFSGLARHLTSATITGTYFLLLIYIGSTVLTALCLGLLKSPFAHRLRIVNNHFGSIASPFPGSGSS